MAHIIPFQGNVPQIDASVFVAETATVIGKVEIAAGASIWYNTVVRGDGNPIKVGKYTNIQDNSTVHTAYHAPTEIGEYVLIGHNVIIHCAKVGDGCLIGMGSVLMNYAEIGENCIIGAGTIITQNKKIPANSLVYGNPARIVRTLKPEEIAHVREMVMDYHKAAQLYLQG